MRAKLGDADDLQTVEAVKKKISERFSDRLKQFSTDADARHVVRSKALENTRRELVLRHREERKQVAHKQEERRGIETKERAARLPTGLKALWFRVTGKYKKIKNQNEQEASNGKQRDQSETQNLVDQQLSERRRLQHEFRIHRHHHALTIKRLNREMGEYLKMLPSEQEIALSNIQQQERDRGRRRSRAYERT